MKKSWSWILFLMLYVLPGHSKDTVPLSFQDADPSGIVHEQLYSESYVLNSFASRLYINKGIYRMAEGKYECAISDFQQAIRLNPASFEAYSLLGQAMVALDRTSEALNSFDKAIDMNPFYADAYFQRANLYQTIGRYQQAYSDYTIAMYIDPLYMKTFGENEIDLPTLEKTVRNELKALRK